MPKPIITSSRRRKGKNSPHHVLTVILALVLCVLAIIYMRLTRNARIPDKSPVAVAPSAAPAEVAAHDDTSVAPAVPSDAPGDQLAPQTPSASSTSSKSSTVASISTPSDKPTPETTEEKPPRHFSRPTEQLLAMMLSTPADCEMPPLPALDPNDAKLNADAILALTNDLVIYETDDERLVALKEAVAELKRQLAEAVKNGGNVADVLNEFRNWQNDGVKVRNDTIKAINEIADDAEAAKALEDANKTLEEDGVVPIKPEEVGFEETD